MESMATALTMLPGRYAVRHSPNGAYWWLHAKPLYATIKCVLAPYWPGERHGHRRRRRVKHNTKHNF